MSSGYCVPRSARVLIATGAL